MYVYMSVHVYMCLCVCVCVYVYLYVYIYICICVYVCICIYVYMYAYICVYMYSIHMDIYIYICVCMYIYIYILQWRYGSLLYPVSMYFCILVCLFWFGLYVPFYVTVSRVKLWNLTANKPCIQILEGVKMKLERLPVWKTFRLP